MVVRIAAPDLSVIIPVFNEEDSVQEIHDGLASTLGRLNLRWEMLFVDDGSTDQTASMLVALRMRDRGVQVSSCAVHQGLSHVLSRGFQHSRGRILVSIDGDLQYDPEEIPLLLRALDGTDVVCGWRRQRKDSWDRVALSRIAFTVRRLALGDRIHDAGCTFRAYRRSCVARLVLQRGEHRFLPYILSRRGCTLREIPVTHRPRRYGKSKFGFSRLSSGLMVLARLWFRSGKSWQR